MITRSRYLYFWIWIAISLGLLLAITACYRRAPAVWPKYTLRYSWNFEQVFAAQVCLLKRDAHSPAGIFRARITEFSDEEMAVVVNRALDSQDGTSHDVALYTLMKHPIPECSDTMARVFNNPLLEKKMIYADAMVSMNMEEPRGYLLNVALSNSEYAEMAIDCLGSLVIRHGGIEDIERVEKLSASIAARHRACELLITYD